MNDLYYYLEMVLRKRTSAQRKKLKKKLKKRRRGTNFNRIKTRPGYKRIKNGSNYILVKMTTKEKVARKKIGKQLKRMKK